MELVNKINIVDANSDYINNVISSLTQNRPEGLTIIQKVDYFNDNVASNIKQLETAKNIELILCTSDSDTYTELSKKENEKIYVLQGEIEDAKLYIKYSHVLLLDDRLSLQIDDEMLYEDNVIYLAKVSDNKSIDGQIYKQYFKDVTINETQFDANSVEKFVREAVCVIPSKLIFHHKFNQSFSFRINIWMSNLMAVTNLDGHVKIGRPLTVCGQLDRGLPTTLNEVLNIIKYIDEKISKRYDQKVTEVLQYFNKLFTSQLKTFIDQGQISKEELIDLMKTYGVNNIYYSSLNKGDARKLVLAYCFPPFNDTSGNVMAKRIFESGQVVDVISNDMSRIRNMDHKLLNIMNHLLDSQIVLEGAQAFSSWQSIEDYIDGVIKSYKMYKNKYEEIYSRVMFPQSHFAAFELKKLNKNLKWVAEFSDPLYTDVSSDVRYAPIEEEDYIEGLKDFVDQKYHHLIDDNVFNICEVLPFIYADELIFTNQNQLDYMLRRFDEEICELVKSKAVISQHPTLPSEQYHLVNSFYRVKEDEINIAYFGNFYDTRGFRQIELVAKYLYEANINNFKIHVFTNLNKKTMKFYQNSAFKEYIVMNQYAPYFEFLNLTTVMDILLIFDATTAGIKPYNPYVPSKLSDYRGSGSKIWALTEENSILDLTQDKNLYITRQIDYQLYAEKMKEMASDLNKPLYSVKNIQCVQ